VNPGGDEFIGEPVFPAPGAFDTEGPSRGEPALPRRFTWRGRGYRVVALLGAWKSDGPGRGGLRRYLRRHWFRVLTEPPAVMTLYFDRQARHRKRPKARWWLYTRAPAPDPPT